MKTHNTLVGFALIALLAAALLAAPLVPAPSYAQADAGQIAITGHDGNIHLYDVASETDALVTDDAISGIKLYSWPTWSNDGQLAYFGTSLSDTPPYRFAIFVRSAAGDDPVTVFTAPDEAFTYAYWSPGDCPDGNCRDLAVLYTSANGRLAVRRVRSTGGGAEFTVEDLAQGGPFYWDWSPDGQSMFWARFSSELAIYDVASASVVQEFTERQGLQRAVDWSPVDNRLLSAVRSGGRSDLVIFDGDTRQVLASGVDGILSFEWSPDGSQVAYADNDGGGLHLANAATAQEIALVSDDVVSFFWSPDGARIAYITLRVERDDVNLKPAPGSVKQEGRPIARWHVYDVSAGTSTPLAAFIPSRDMLYYLQFYDQFARSHRLWSPDSRYLVYGETTRDGQMLVSLLDTRTEGSTPVTLMEGTFGVFSW